MSYTFNLDGTGNALQIALIRDEIDDISYSAAENGGAVGVDYFVTDERILARMTSAVEELPSGSLALEIRLSVCASILDTLATNQAFILKKQETLEQSMDGPAVAAAIRAHVKSLLNRLAAARKEREAEEGAAKAKLYGKPSSISVPVNTVF